MAIKMEAVEAIVKIGAKEELKIGDLMMVGYMSGFITLSKVEKKHDSGRG
jgi:hypothetical protein